MSAHQVSILGLFAVQFGLILWLVRDVRIQGLGFLTTFNLLVTIALVLPFCAISAHASGLITVPVHIAGSPIAPVALALGDGLRPLLLLTGFQLSTILGSVLAQRHCPTGPLPLEQDANGWRHQALWAAGLGAIASTYILIRAFAVPDFPLWVLLTGERHGQPVRDLAFSYSSSRNVPWLLLPSIHSQFYRIVLPLSAMLMLCAWWRQRRAWMLWTGIGLAVLTMAMSLGTGKRTPIIYLGLWLALLWAMSRPLSVRLTLRLGLLCAAGMGLVLLISTQYTSQASAFLGHRIVFGESVSDYLALEHHPHTYPYRGWSVLGAYAGKMGGGAGKSFSQEWKQEVTGGKGRGFDAVGFYAEFHIAFGPIVCACVAMIWGFLLRAGDLVWCRRYGQGGSRPMLAGMMTIVAAMSVKGFVAQVFTGGLATLGLLLAAWVMWRRRSTQTDLTHSP